MIVPIYIPIPSGEEIAYLLASGFVFFMLAIQATRVLRDRREECWIRNAAAQALDAPWLHEGEPLMPPSREDPAESWIFLDGRGNLRPIFRGCYLEKRAA